MKVTEKDIFNFVFFPHMVRQEIKSFLSSIESTNEIILFYKDLKSSIKQEVPLKLKQKLSKKFGFYKLDNVITLYPVEEIKKKNNTFVLAAASAAETPKIATKTFYDEDKSYIIKVINYEKNSKIFVFSTQQEVIKNFDIVIQPQNEKYHISDNMIPLEIDKQISPESIQIEFNLSLQ